MFKRFQKTLDGVSSDSEESSDLDLDAPPSSDLDSEEHISDDEGHGSSDDAQDDEDAQQDDAEASSASSASADEEEAAEAVVVGVVTEEELAQAAATSTGAEEDEEDGDYNYHCTLCPHRVLASLNDVRKHLQGKEHLARERRAAAQLAAHPEPPLPAPSHSASPKRANKAATPSAAASKKTKKTRSVEPSAPQRATVTPHTKHAASANISASSNRAQRRAALNTAPFPKEKDAASVSKKRKDAPSDSTVSTNASRAHKKQKISS